MGDLLEALVSIVVPIYNVELYLEKCIQSILEQSYKNIEVLLIDDGSTDKSGEICDVYAGKDERIKVIHKKNGGLSSARNIGIKNSNAEYICFIDSDDWINREFTKVLMENILNSDAEIAVCGFIYEYSDKKTCNKIINSSKILNGQDALYNLYNQNYLTMTVAWNKIYKKSLFNNIRYEEGIINEDENIIHELFYKSAKIVCIDKYLYHYRIRKNSITKSSFSLKNLDSVYVYENRLSFFENRNEALLTNLTLERYFRVLLESYYKVYFSELKNKELYSKELTNKIDDNMTRFLSLKKMNFANRILLYTYNVNNKAAIQIISLVNLIKNNK